MHSMLIIIRTCSQLEALFVSGRYYLKREMKKFFIHYSRQQGYTKNGTGINLDCTILSDSCYTSFQDVAFAFFGSGMGGC